MFEKILNRLGYVKESKFDNYRNLVINPFTENELSLMIGEFLTDVDYDTDEKVQEKIFSEARNVEGLVQYLRETSKKDIMRYFSAYTLDEQKIIRGAFARTSFLKAKISGEKKRSTKLEGIKYG